MTGSGNTGPVANARSSSVQFMNISSSSSSLYCFTRIPYLDDSRCTIIDVLRNAYIAKSLNKRLNYAGSMQHVSGQKPGFLYVPFACRAETHMHLCVRKRTHDCTRGKLIFVSLCHTESLRLTIYHNDSVCVCVCVYQFLNCVTLLATQIHK